MKLKPLVQAAVIAATYAGLTLALAPISYGLVQVRVAEALTILPFFTAAAIPGLFVGCLIANIIGGLGILDIVFGSLATLLAAFLTSKMKNKWLAPLPPVLVNAIVIGTYLSIYYFNVPVYAGMAYVAVGQVLACYGLGMILLFQLEKHKGKLFS
ncbi:MAG: QueT transporter family protein [Clostridia bacterium]